LFYEQFTNNIVLLDTNTGLLQDIEIDLKDGYIIRYIKTNGNVALICAMSNDADKDRYYLTTFVFEKD